MTIFAVSMAGNICQTDAKSGGNLSETPIFVFTSFRVSLALKCVFLDLESTMILPHDEFLDCRPIRLGYTMEERREEARTARQTAE